MENARNVYSENASVGSRLGGRGKYVIMHGTRILQTDVNPRPQRRTLRDAVFIRCGRDGSG
jgi:hypothetical protein